jgi:hypothetical protein
LDPRFLQGFAAMKNRVDEAVKEGRWIIFVGHEIGKRGYQVTDTAALEALCEYLKDPAHGIRLGTVAKETQSNLFGSDRLAGKQLCHRLQRVNL